MFPRSRSDQPSVLRNCRAIWSQSETDCNSSQYRLKPGVSGCLFVFCPLGKSPNCVYCVMWLFSLPEAFSITCFSLLSQLHVSIMVCCEDVDGNLAILPVFFPHTPSSPSLSLSLYTSRSVCLSLSPLSLSAGISLFLGSVGSHSGQFFNHRLRLFGVSVCMCVCGTRCVMLCMCLFGVVVVFVCLG